MIEFLQAYGTWIVLAGFFILMLRMHAGGGGCGMGHPEHGASTDEKVDPVARQKAIDSDDAKTHSSSGCH